MEPQAADTLIDLIDQLQDIAEPAPVSGSMDTRDFTGPNAARGSRLDGVKSVLDGFIADRRDDRIGLIVFGDAPYVLVPFTRDTGAARSLLATLAPGMAGQNTMLGDAIGLAIRSFEASEVEALILILLSAGTDTGSRMAPQKAADIAEQNGVVIHTIAVGNPDATSDAEKVDIATLRTIASATGGSFNGPRTRPASRRHLRPDRRHRHARGADDLLAYAHAAGRAAGRGLRRPRGPGLRGLPRRHRSAPPPTQGAGMTAAVALAFTFLRPPRAAGAAVAAAPPREPGGGPCPWSTSPRICSPR